MEKYGWLKNTAVGLLTIAIMAGICMAVSAIGSVASIRQSKPYQHSINLALENPAVKEALGEPLKIGRFPQGAVNVANGGDAELYIPLNGAQTNAAIRVNATNTNGTWKYYAIRVDTQRGARIDLLEP